MPSWTDASGTDERVLSLVAPLSEIVADPELLVDEMTAGTLCSGTDLVSCDEMGNEVVCFKESAAVSFLASTP